MDELSFIKSHSFECLHKVQVVNPSTQELQLVPCGTCPACLLRKSYVNEIKSKTQKFTSKYCYFISLTYSVYNCPSYRISVTPLDSDRVFCRLSDSGVRRSLFESGHPSTYRGHSKKVMSPIEFVCSKAYYERYTKQADLGIRKYTYDPRFSNTYGYLLRDDLTLFMKRFRRELFLKIGKYESIHVYFVGEYGIEHFRPHFHLLLFFDSDQVSQNIGYALNRSWRFGRVDWSADRSSSISYVASYVNSITFLPFHLREYRQIAPFGRFSNHFGISLFEHVRKDVKKGDFSAFFTGVGVTVDGKTLSIRPPLSVRDSCFFRPAKYRGATVSTLLTLLFNIRRATLVFRNKEHNTCYSITRRFTQWLGRVKESFHLSLTPGYRQILYYIGINKDNFSFLLFPENLSRIHQRLYALFSQANLFLRNIGFSIFSCKIPENVLLLPLSNSLKFYHEYDFKNYQDYCQSRDCYPGDIRSYFFRVSNETQESFRMTKIGSNLIQYQQQLLNQRVKHREINEKNRFFVSA